MVHVLGTRSRYQLSLSFSSSSSGAFRALVLATPRTGSPVAGGYRCVTVHSLRPWTFSSRPAVDVFASVCLFVCPPHLCGCVRVVPPHPPPPAAAAAAAAAAAVWRARIFLKASMPLQCLVPCGFRGEDEKPWTLSCEVSILCDERVCVCVSQGKQGQGQEPHCGQTHIFAHACLVEKSHKAK